MTININSYTIYTNSYEYTEEKEKKKPDVVDKFLDELQHCPTDSEILNECPNAEDWCNIL